MRSGEEMYKYCVANKFGRNNDPSWGVKHFKVIEKSLMGNEEVLMPFMGLHSSSSMGNTTLNFAYALTNRRIIMAHKKVVGETIQSISLNNINDITVRKNMFLGYLTIDTLKETIEICFDRNEAVRVYEELHRQLELARQGMSGNTIIDNQVSSPTDELKKLKELLDMGAITKKEYEAKKKDLLEKI